MSVNLHENINTSSSIDETATYLVVGNSSGMYNVNATVITKEVISLNGQQGSINDTELVTMTVLFNGTITQITVNGQTYSGAEAQLEALFVMLPFVFETSTDASLSGYTGGVGFVAVNSSTITVGGQKLNVTDYSMNPLPNTTTDCTTGATTTITQFLLQIGSVPSIKYNLLTYVSLQESTSGPPALTIALTVKLLSFTIAGH